MMMMTTTTMMTTAIKRRGISTWKVEYPTWTSPTDADAIAAAIVQTSAVIVYTLYDSSWSQYSCIRTSKSNRVVYRFSLVRTDHENWLYTPPYFKIHILALKYNETKLVSLVNYTLAVNFQFHFQSCTNDSSQWPTPNPCALNVQLLKNKIQRARNMWLNSLRPSDAYLRQ